MGNEKQYRIPTVNLIYSNYLTKLDENIDPWRFWLIFYGVIPSILALFSPLEEYINRINEQFIFIYIAASILLIFLIFILIRTRYREWYLNTDSIGSFSASTTIIILILAMLVIGTSGIVHNRYSIGIPHSWSWNDWMAIIESFIFAVINLVISSTFFMVVLMMERNVHGLPSIDFIKLMAKLRNNMRNMKSNKIWVEYISLDDELINSAEKNKSDLNQAIICTENCPVKKSLKIMHTDVTNLIEILKEIKSSGNAVSKQIIWNIYFAEMGTLSDDEKIRRFHNKDKCASIERLKKLKIGT